MYSEVKTLVSRLKLAKVVITSEFKEIRNSSAKLTKRYGMLPIRGNQISGIVSKGALGKVAQGFGKANIKLGYTYSL